jgi:diguanylate cyclase (GGDEF)-like protein
VNVEDRVVRALSARSGGVALLLDPTFTVAWASDSVVSILGHRDVVGRNAADLVHPDDVGLVLDVLARTTERAGHASVAPTHCPEPADVRVLTAAGDWLTFELTSWDLLDDPGVRGVFVTGRPVSDRRDLSTAIEQLGSGLPLNVVLPTVIRLMERSMGGGFVRVAVEWRDHTGAHVAFARDTTPLPAALCAMARFGWSIPPGTGRVLDPNIDDELAGVRELADHFGYRASFVAPIEAPGGADVLGVMVAWGTSSVDFHLAEQSPLHIALRLAALAIADHNSKRELRWAASHDMLTGLFNRAEFERMLARAADDDLVLLYVDLDAFKPVNDTYGHPVGDSVLRCVAQRIAHEVDDAGVVGRLGGDEFAVMCRGTRDPDHGRAIAERIVAALRQPIAVDDVVVHIGASIGVAVGAQPLIPSLLTAAADRALYRAKHIGKNTVCIA